MRPVLTNILFLIFKCVAFIFIKYPVGEEIGEVCCPLTFIFVTTCIMSHSLPIHLFSNLTSTDLLDLSLGRSLTEWCFLTGCYCLWES